MARYDKNENTLTFTNEESEGEYCPSCMTGLDLMPPTVEDGELVRAWECPACGLKGNVYCSPRFDRHVVDLSGVNRMELQSNTTHCLNGVISIGDYVLPVADDAIPCLPGQVTAIDLADAEDGVSDSQQNDVYVDFSIYSDEFSEKRKQEVVEFYEKRLRSPCSFQEVNCDNVFINPDFLIKINDVAPETMKEIMESEENAIRHALRVVRNMVPWPWWKNDLSD